MVFDKDRRLKRLASTSPTPESFRDQPWDDEF